jgi:hypothetical protein
MAMNGGDVSRFFTNEGEMSPPVKRVEVDFTFDMLKELDAVARELKNQPSSYYLSISAPSFRPAFPGSTKSPVIFFEHSGKI